MKPPKRIQRAGFYCECNLFRGGNDESPVSDTTTGCHCTLSNLRYKKNQDRIPLCPTHPNGRDTSDIWNISRGVSVTHNLKILNNGLFTVRMPDLNMRDGNSWVLSTVDKIHCLSTCYIAGCVTCVAV